MWLAQSRTDGEQRRGAESEPSGAGGDSTRTQAERRVQEGFPSPLPTALRTRSSPGAPNHLCDLWRLTRQPPSAAGKLSLGKHSPPSSSQGCFQMLMLLSFYVFIYFTFIEKHYCEGVTQSCPILCNPVDYSPPGAAVCGILQARILEWVAMPSSPESSRPRYRSQVSCIAQGLFTV